MILHPHKIPLLAPVTEMGKDNPNIIARPPGNHMEPKEDMEGLEDVEEMEDVEDMGDVEVDTKCS